MRLLIIPRVLLLSFAIVLASCTLVVVEAFSFCANHPFLSRHHHHGRLSLPRGPTRSRTTLLQVGDVALPSGDDDGPGVVTAEMEHVLRTALENVRAVMTLQQEDDTSKDTDSTTTTNPPEDENDEDDATLLLEEVVVSSNKEGRHAVGVAPSTIPGAGRGLLAQQDIPAGSITGFYPVHGLGVDFGASSFIMGMDPCDDQAFYSTSSEHRRPTDDYLQYLIGTRPLLQDGTTTTSNHIFESANALVFLNANPNRAVHPLWTSHCVNDAATVEENTEAGIVDYYQRSRQGKNCVTVPFGPSPMMATITTRDVVQGEELFTSYGCAYWIPYILGDGDEEEEMTDVTEAIQREVQESAQDLFQCYRAAQTKYEEPAAALEAVFANKQQQQIL